MKADMLFGVQFIENQTLKDIVLTHYTRWKTDRIRSEMERLELAAVKFGELLGLSPDEVKSEIALAYPDSHQLPDFSGIEAFLREDRCRHYYITKPVLTMCEKIKVKEPFDLEWLQQIPDGKRQLNFGNRFFRYEKVGKSIIAMDADRVAGMPAMEYNFFYFDLGKKNTKGDEIINDYDDKRPNAFDNFIDEASRKLFFQLITFMELADVQEIIVRPGQKHGTKKSEYNLLNQQRFPITVVQTNWNKIIRTEGFGVDGHLRKQAYGPGMKLRKLIWIDPFHKNGYNLNAKKTNESKRKGPGL